MADAGNYVLGLDLGSNSIGWALIGSDSQSDAKRIVDLGVRVFPEGVDRDTSGAEQSKNAKRREARGARRQRSRRVMRREVLLKNLKRNGLLPQDDTVLEAVFEKDPYVLRKKGLDDPLEPYEFGRALFHLNQRRGFKSNRKTGKANENSTVLKACNELQQNIDAAECRTLGEYLAGLNLENDRYRQRYTYRSMYEHEFIKLWEKQQSCHPELFNDTLRKKLHHILFHQRPLKPSDNLIGDCELEEGEKRCPRGDWFARRFRLLQDVNNLKINHREGHHRDLSTEERDTLLSYIVQYKDQTFDQLRKELGLLETDRFNLEDQEGHKKLKGDVFNNAMRGTKLFGKTKWDAMSVEEKQQLNDDLLNLEDDELKEKLIQTYGFNDDQIEAVFKISLPQGYMSYSRKAIKNLLPFMENGELVHEARDHAGYPPPWEQKQTVSDYLDAPEDLRNPIVNQTLHEVRKVVNAIVREYGKPQKIIVEMARDLKTPKKRRDEIRLDQFKRERENDDARKKLMIDINITNPSRDDVIKYKLWLECGKACPYTGKSISQHQLFGPTPEFQVEHILPYSRSLDDSYMNKTLCYGPENMHVKKNQTPFEAYGGDSEKYDQVKQRIVALPWGKRKKFLQETLNIDKCIERKLNDTRYISRAVVAYLQALGVHVMGSRGEATHDLRHEWGLDRILNLIGNTKNRDDHRHHAVDAAVVALTSPKHLKELARFKYTYERDTFAPPWENFRKELAEKVNSINVSHRVRRKIAGALHKETSYGPTKENDIYVYRKPLEALTPAMVNKIRDKKVCDMVRDRLREHGIDPDKHKGAFPKEVWKEPLWMYSKKGKKIPIKRLRICDTFTGMIPIKNEKGEPYRAVAPGSNHHIVIFEAVDASGKTKRAFQAVTMYEAIRRVREGQSVIQRDGGNGSRFLYSLSINELFEMDMGDGVSLLHRVQKIVQDGRIVLRPHTFAGKINGSDKPPVIQRKNYNTLKGYKVTVDPLGRIHPAND